MKKILKVIKSLFINIRKIIEKTIVIPITKLILGITNKITNSSKTIENWLSKTNTLLFVSLFIALLLFVVIDRKIITYAQSSAEVLKSQPVTAIFNREAYVVEGLPETVDITLVGSKVNLFIAKQSPSPDITVDLTGLKPGQHKVSIKYTQSISDLEYTISPSVATVIIYDKVSETKSLTVDVLNKDMLDSKLVIDDISVNVDKVIVKGAEHQLAKVASVKAFVDINNLVSQETGIQTMKDITLKAYDINGSVVDVEIVPSKVDADITISSPSKELTIKVIPIGQVAFGKAIKTIEASATKVVVYGSLEVLKDLNYIEVPIDVEGLKTDLIGTKQDLIKPTGIRSMSVSSITVDIKLDTVTDKDITDVRIDFRNLNDSYRANAATVADETVVINVKGVESVLEKITSEFINAYVDLTGLTEGVHEVEVKVEGSDNRVQYLSKNKKIAVKITKK
ncbi:MAG: CdaR family protein [Bacilli bacterium]|nr:CdaR family protein [Bacilli bacterium]